MEDFFIRLLEINLSAAFMISAVLALRLIFRAVPKQFRVLLWGAVGLRLIVPFSLEIPLLPNTFERGIPSPSPAEFSARLTETSSNGFSMSPLDIMSIIWACGVILLLGYMLISLLRLKLRLRESVSGGENIRICDSIKSSFVLGILRPIVYLPASLDESSKPYVLMHERAHIERGDVIIKPLGFVVAAFHWFNPFVWIAYLLFARDIELACDERVIGAMDSDDKKAYSSALLLCSARSFAVAACPFAFGENPVKKRIKSVLGYKKPNRRTVTIAAAVCAAVGALFFLYPTQAQAQPVKAQRTEFDSVIKINEPKMVQPKATEPTATEPAATETKATVPAATVPESTEPIPDEAEIFRESDETDSPEVYDYSDSDYSDAYSYTDAGDSDGYSDDSDYSDYSDYSGYSSPYSNSFVEIQPFEESEAYKSSLEINSNYFANSRGSTFEIPTYDPFTDANGSNVLKWDIAVP